MSETGLSVMPEIIVVEQLPVITERLAALSDVIDAKVSEAISMAVTEANVKEIKKVRAGLNKDFAQIEDLRKRVKAAVMEPYEQFEAAYRVHVTDKFRPADADLKGKIDEIEDALRARKMEQVKAYFNEYAAANGVTGYADFDRQMKGLRTSYSMPEFQRICQERIDPLVSGLKAIEAQPENLRPEILAEFRKTLNAPEAITTVSERHKAIEAMRKQQEDHEARQAAEAESAQRVQDALPALDPLPPPTKKTAADEDPVMTVAFRVTAQKSKLKLLKQYLIDRGYTFE